MTDCKTCSKCGEVKAVAEFRLRHRQCKECARKQNLAYRKANAEKLAAKNSTYRKANAEKLAERKAAYYKANAERLVKKAAAWHKKNPEKVFLKRAAYRKANSEKRAKKSRIAASEMSPAYIAGVIGLPVSNLTPELLALKREHLLHKRDLRELKKILTSFNESQL